MHLAFDICQGIGISAAIGIRPFLPSLAAGALAAGGVELDFGHTSYGFLQQAPFLLVMLILAALSATLDGSASRQRLGGGTTALTGLTALASLALAALFFAASLRRGGSPAWPGIVAGVLCASVGLAATRPFLARVRHRLEQTAATVGLPVIADGAALLVALLSVLAPPLGAVALLGLLVLLDRGRHGAERSFAGLRILR